MNRIQIVLTLVLVGRIVNAAPLPDTTKMNVLFFDLEDWTAEALGCYGNDLVKTPHIDHLASGGMRFDRAYCQGPVCNASRSSFTTGLRSPTTRTWGNDEPMDKTIPEWATTIPEVLKANGIYSVNIGKMFHHTWTANKQMAAFDELGMVSLPEGYTGIPLEFVPPPNYPERPKKHFRFVPDPEMDRELTRRYEERQRIWKTAEKGSKEWNQARALFQQLMAETLGDCGDIEEYHSDGQKMRLAAQRLRSFAKEKKRFFLSVGSSRPHTPLTCPKKYVDMYNPEDMKLTTATPDKDKNIPPIARRYGQNYDIFNQFEITDEASRKALAAYYACASFMDAQVGLVLDTLKETGLDQNTIVIFFADHGFQLGEHGLWSKLTLFEQSTQVPLIIRVPGASTNGQPCDQIVELVDLLPTLCELLQMKQPERLEGVSLVPLLKTPTRPWKKAAFTVCERGPHLGYNVRTKDWAYNEWRTRQGQEVIVRELYHMKTDPLQQTNLAEQDPYKEKQAELAALLADGWQSALPGTW
ncbi:sulfatase [Planctomycetota bacterium]